MSMDTDMQLTLKAVCTGIAAIAGFAAGILWLVSTRVGTDAPKTATEEGVYVGGLIAVQSGERLLDLYPTLRRQSSWNSYAAIAASVSAFAQVVLLFL